jgi:hypothetical protein
VHASFISLTSDLCYAKITHTTLFITSYTAHRAHKSPRIDLQAPPPHTGSIYNERPSILFTSANVYERQTSITTAKSCSWTWWNCFTLLRLNTQVHQSYTSDFTEKTTYEQPTRWYWHVFYARRTKLLCPSTNAREIQRLRSFPSYHRTNCNGSSCVLHTPSTKSVSPSAFCAVITLPHTVPPRLIRIASSHTQPSSTPLPLFPQENKY